jgi:hypothetical protein
MVAVIVGGLVLGRFVAQGSAFSASRRPGASHGEVSPELLAMLDRATGRPAAPATPASRPDRKPARDKSDRLPIPVIGKRRLLSSGAGVPASMLPMTWRWHFLQQPNPMMMPGFGWNNPAAIAAPPIFF